MGLYNPTVKLKGKAMSTPSEQCRATTSQEVITMVAVKLARSGRFNRVEPLANELQEIFPEATAEQHNAALQELSEAFSWVIEP